MIPRCPIGKVAAACGLLLTFLSQAPFGGAAAAGAQAGPQSRSAATTPAPTERGTSTVTITVAAEDGTAVKNATVSLMATPALPAGGPSTTPGGRPSAVGQGTAAPGTAPAAVQEMTLAVRDRGRSSIFQRQDRTTPGGTVVFSQLPAGAYFVSAGAPAGYVGLQVTTRLQVEAGAQVTSTLKLSRGGVITGRVVDEDGDPVTGARISVFRVSRGSRPQALGASQQSSNDLGIYRVWSLPAGSYLVSATYEDRPRVSFGGYPDEGGPVDGYVATYFPGVAAFDAARPVEVRSGQETAGIDVPLLRGRLGTLAVRVIDSAGTPVGSEGMGVTVQLVARGSSPAANMRNGSRGVDGVIRLSNIPAGDYYLSAVVSRGTGPSAQREAGYLPVTVNGDEVSVTLQTNAGATISGRVVIEGVPPAQSGTPGASRQPTLRVMARNGSSAAYSPAFSNGEGTNSGTVRPDGSFTLTGVRGPVHIAASGGRAALKSVRRGALDISGQPIELLGTERIDDVAVVMTYDTGSIEGNVIGDDDEPMAGAVVIAVPDDPDKWSAGSPFVRAAGTRAGGPGSGAASAAFPGMNTAGQATQAATGFQLAQLPAGRYLVIGVADASTSLSFDRDAIERLRADASTVMVDVGQTATVKVRGVR